MHSFSRRKALAAIASLPGAAAAQLIGNREGAWSIRGTDPVEIFFGERRITAYHAAYQEGLPRLEPIVGPTGRNVVAGSVMDKPVASPPAGAYFSFEHLGGLRFPGFGGGGSGRILHKGMNGVFIRGDVLTIRTKSEWQEVVAGGRRIASDRRETTLFYREEGTLVIDVSVELMADAGDLEIPGETRGGWFFTLAPGLRWTADGDVSLHNAEGKAGAEVVGSASTWISIEGKDSEGAPCGIAIFDHPKNPGTPARWDLETPGLVGANAFGRKDAAPTVVPNGESLHFRYRNLIFSGDAGLDVAAAYEKFAASEK